MVSHYGGWGGGGQSMPNIGWWTLIQITPIENLDIFSVSLSEPSSFIYGLDLARLEIDFSSRGVILLPGCIALFGIEEQFL
jgi:hypothetical protein